MTVVPTPRDLLWAHHPGVDAPHPSGTGSTSTLPMTDEQKEAAAAKPKHPVGFTAPAKRRKR